MIAVTDLFSGAGGASLGFHGVADNVWGFELDTDACATQRAAGMLVLRADLSQLTPIDTDTDHYHLHASPPCTTFSLAGKGKGRDHIEALSSAAHDVLCHESPIDTAIYRWGLDLADETTRLSLVPARWIAETMPDTISMEQVRGVLPLWEAYADALDALGYETWTGLLHAEQYGIPQTRQRAWLIATRVGTDPTPPAPTHSRYHSRSPERIDEGLPRWVSMAEALDLDEGGVGFPRRNDGRPEDEGLEYRSRDLRPVEAPAFNLTEKARSWTHMMQGGVSGEGRPRSADAPAPSMSGKGTASVTNDPDAWYGDKRKKILLEEGMTEERRNPGEWEHLRPSTTVMGDPRISGPGCNDPTVANSQNNGPNARRITVREAAILQGFPAEYPWQGSKTSQYRQIGNAVCPPIAEMILRKLVRR